MTEVSNYVPSKEQYEILKDVLGFGAEVIGLIYPKAAGAIAARRTDNLITVIKMVKKKLEEAGLKQEERKAIALKLGIPFIENASLEEDPSLQELWANLLTNALNPQHSEEVRTIFIDIIQKLSSFDALVLNAFHLSSRPLIPKPQDMIGLYTKDGYKTHPRETVNQSISVLKALGLLTDMAPSVQLRLDNNFAVQTTEIHLTPLGSLFIDSCVKDAAHRSPEAAD